MELDATPRADDTERIAVVAEMRKSISNWDYLDAATQQSVLDTALSARRSQRNGGNGQDREAHVQMRFKELMRQRGMNPDKPETWTDYDTRYACMEQAQNEVPGGPTPEPEFTGDPHEVLQQARHDHAEALATVGKAKAAVERATTLLATAETELQAFHDLDNQIADHTAQAIRDDSDDALPWHLEAASRDRSKCLDRADRAKAALLRLQSELRLATANFNVVDKRLRSASVRIVYAEGIPLAEAMSAAEAEWLNSAERLLALANATLDQTTALPPEVVRAVNRELPRPQRRDDLVNNWRIRLQEVMRDA